MQGCWAQGPVLPEGLFCVPPCHHARVLLLFLKYKLEGCDCGSGIAQPLLKLHNQRQIVSASIGGAAFVPERTFYQGSSYSARPCVPTAEQTLGTVS